VKQIYTMYQVGTRIQGHNYVTYRDGCIVWGSHLRSASSLTTEWHQRGSLADCTSSPWQLFVRQSCEGDHSCDSWRTYDMAVQHRVRMAMA